MDKYIDKNTGYFDENLAIDNNEEELILEAGFASIMRFVGKNLKECMNL